MCRTDLAGRAEQQDERSHFLDTPAEYQWARDAAGLMPSTIDQLVKPVLDHYFAGPGEGHFPGSPRGLHLAALSPRTSCGAPPGNSDALRV